MRDFSSFHRPRCAHVLTRNSCPRTASKIVQVFVTEGQEVEEGAPLVAVEAMKTVRCFSPPFLVNRRPHAHLLLCMQEHVLRAAKSGKVEKVTVKEGDLVPEGKVLVAFVEEAPEEGADSPKA